MWDWISTAGTWVWSGALAATLPALVIAVWVRVVPAQPATRHTLWLVALAWFAAAPLVPAVPPGLRLWNHLTWSRPEVSPQRLATVPQLVQVDDACSGEPLLTVPTPPRTGARETTGAPLSLAQAAFPNERRSKFSFEFDVDSAPMFSNESLVDTIPVQPSLLAAPLKNTAHRGRSVRQIDHENNQPDVILTNWLAKTRTLGERLYALIIPFAAGTWLAGAFLLLATRLARTWMFVRRLHIIPTCPKETCDLVASAARHIGLDRTPRVILVNNEISPMITFLTGPRLILPEQLWTQLDDAGRRTILYHELAHLYRRDHWARALDCIVSAVYWWHPLVWYVRNRLAQEAENCCDAWVTWLLPAGRRAYARALMKTNEFISLGRMPTPALGIGVSTVRAKRIARRLTMIMKEPSRPRLSASGCAVAAALVLVGWIAAPAWSKPTSSTPPTPPTPPTAATPATPPVMAISPMASVAPTPAIPPIQPIPPVPPVAPIAATPRPGVPGLLQAGASFVNGLMTTTNDGPKARGRRDRDGDDDGDDDDDLEARLERLERKLEQLSGSSPRSPRATMVTPRSDPDGRQIAREYHLPSGKLEALLALMSREDVPVKVQGGGDKIIVHATHQQHEIFEAFVHLIDPEGRVSPAPRAAVRSFSVGRSGGHTPRPGEAVSDTLKKQIEEINREREKVQREAEKIRAKAETLRSKADGMKDEAARSDLRRQAQELARQAREMARQAREMQRHARDSLRERTQSRANDDGDDDDDEVADRAPRADHDGGREHPGASADANLGAEAYAAGYQLHTQGQYDKAIELFKKSAEAGNNKGASLYNIACGYARKGEKDKAFEYLAKAWAAGYRDADHMRQDDDLDNIRNDKRFGEIVAQAKDKDDDDDDGDNN